MRFLKQFLQRIPVRQLLVVFCAGALLMLSTACGSPQAGAPQTPNPSTSGQGMYPHADTERDTTAADAKTDRAVKQAEQRRQKIQSPKDYFNEVEPAKAVKEQAQDVGQSAKRAADEVGDSAEQAAKNAARNTQQSLKNLKQNTQQAAENAAEAVDQAT